MRNAPSGAVLPRIGFGDARGGGRCACAWTAARPARAPVSPPPVGGRASTAGYACLNPRDARPPRRDRPPPRRPPARPLPRDRPRRAEARRRGRSHELPRRVSARPRSCPASQSHFRRRPPAPPSGRRPARAGGRAALPSAPANSAALRPAVRLRDVADDRSAHCAPTVRAGWAQALSGRDPIST